MLNDLNANGLYTFCDNMQQKHILRLMSLATGPERERDRGRLPQSLQIVEAGSGFARQLIGRAVCVPRSPRDAGLSLLF